jgi:hypothetical protein
MAFGKSADDRAQEREAHRRVDEQHAILSTPAGQAILARQKGQRSFEIQLPVSHRMRDATGLAPGALPQTLTTAKVNPDADLLGDIENIGWRLEHVDYVHHDDASRGGSTVDIYLFRRVEPG